MPNDLGARHWLGFKKQAVANTPETTVNTFLTTTEIEVASNPEHIERKSLISVGRNMPMVPGLLKPGGKATVEPAASQPHPFFWAMGAVNTTTPTSGVYLHTITMSDPVRLTCEADRVFDKCKQGDAYISKLKLTATPGELPTLELEWLALSHADGATVTSSPTFVTDLLTCSSVAVSIGGSAVATCSSVEIELDNGLEQVPVLIADSTGPRVIRRKEPPKVTGSLKFIDVVPSELARLAAASTFSLVVELQGPVITGAYKKFLRVTLPACQYTGGIVPTIGAEVLTSEAQFQAGYDTTTGRQMLVEAQNTISSIDT